MGQKSAKNIILTVFKKGHKDQKDLSKENRACIFFLFYCEQTGHNNTGVKLYGMNGNLS